MTEQYDVAVIGAGPSGSTAAHLLAEAGARVLVIERETFPRFHIGESLLPASLDVFRRLGVEVVGKEHVKKAGAEFYEEATGQFATYLFSDQLGGVPEYAYQVDRATLDQALAQSAVRAGAILHEGERVTGVDLDGGARPPIVATDRGRYEARYVLDATGLDSLFAYSNDSRRRIEAFGLGAVFRHFGDLRPSIAAELLAQGNIKVLFVDEGWIWAIPLGEGRLSVGLVTRHKGLKDEWLDAAIAASPEVSRILEGARPEGPHKKLASFSFYNPRAHGPRWSCIGDAACFLDPVFSSGVTFAMLGSTLAVEQLLPALAQGREGDAALMDAHAEKMRNGYEVFATMINAIYRRRLLPGLFFTTDQNTELRKGLTSLLAGDVWRTDNAFLEKLWRSRLRVRLDDRGLSMV
ncbi:MAG: NAD(P)/FAD-dependent oxidoreductase [Sandaracinaceae bacterium]|nr:NAD(P)/FAD-dependent oxidoreductase [Sandaracinaceae bacterium]